MEPYTAYLLVALLAQALAVLVPYLLKVKDDQTVKFDITYFYSLVIVAVTTAMTLIPDTNVIDLKTMVIVFLAGLGAQAAVNKANSVRINAAGNDTVAKPTVP